jgi:hypothetical protein
MIARSGERETAVSGAHCSAPVSRQQASVWDLPPHRGPVDHRAGPETRKLTLDMRSHPPK